MLGVSGNECWCRNCSFPNAPPNAFQNASRTDQHQQEYPDALPSMSLSPYAQKYYRFKYIPRRCAAGETVGDIIQATPARRDCDFHRSFTITDDGRVFWTLEPRAATLTDIQTISPQAGRVAPSTHLSGNPALSQCLSERIPQRTAGDDLRITFRKILYFWNPSFLSPISNFGTISRITLVWQVLWQS